MSLEEVIETYGCVDYYDMNTGYTYHLSEIAHEPEGLYVIKVTQDGLMIGTAQVRKS